MFLMTDHNNKIFAPYSLPEVLLNYLAILLESEKNICHIRLVPQKLGMGDVQDVICETENEILTRRVFGFNPVEISLDIKRLDNRIEMTVAA